MLAPEPRAASDAWASWRAAGLGQARRRSSAAVAAQRAAASSASAPPFAGRERASSRSSRRARRARARAAFSLVLVEGESGLGKSALVERVRARGCAGRAAPTCWCSQPLLRERAARLQGLRRRGRPARRTLLRSCRSASARRSCPSAPRCSRSCFRCCERARDRGGRARRACPPTRRRAAGRPRLLRRSCSRSWPTSATLCARDRRSAVGRPGELRLLRSAGAAARRRCRS